MSLSQVEQYQQLEQQYEQARRDYELAESQYHGAAGVKTANPDDPALNAQYQALLQKSQTRPALCRADRAPQLARFGD